MLVRFCVVPVHVRSGRERTQGQPLQLILHLQTMLYPRLRTTLVLQEQLLLLLVLVLLLVLLRQTVETDQLLVPVCW